MIFLSFITIKTKAFLKSKQQIYTRSIKNNMVNVKDFGAYGDANYYNWKDKKYYVDKSYTKLSHDDTKSILDAVNYIRSNNISKKLFFSKGNYKMTKSLEVNGFYVEGDSSTIQSTASIAVKILKGNDRQSILSHIGITGISGPNSIGLYCTNTSTNTSSVTIDSVTIFNFADGIKFYDNAYLYRFYNLKVSNVESSIVFPNKTNNSGENISFYNSVFSAKDKVVDCGNRGEINFFSCSFDYFANKAFYIHDGGTASLYGCHIEADGSLLKSSIIDLLSSGSSFKMFGGSIIFVNKSYKNKRSIPYVIDCNTGQNNLGAIFDGVSLDDCNTTSGYFSIGNGIVKINDLTHYPYSHSIQMINSNLNLMTDGGFESANLKDTIFITNDTSSITDPLKGDNIYISIDTTAANTGHSSLRINKIGTIGSPAGFAIAVPINESVKCSEQLYIKSNALIGTFKTSCKYATLNSSHIPKIDQPAINHEKTVIPSTISSWSKQNLDNNTFIFKRSPKSSTYYVIVFDLTSMGAGSIWLDDIVVNQIN
jgi:hypothetical protein